jgi:hypothetical protein
MYTFKCSEVVESAQRGYLFMVSKEKLKLSIWVHPMHFKLKKMVHKLRNYGPSKVARIKKSEEKKNQKRNFQNTSLAITKQ